MTFVAYAMSAVGVLVAKKPSCGLIGFQTQRIATMVYSLNPLRDGLGEARNP
jgi:hypothetical protein